MSNATNICIGNVIQQISCIKMGHKKMVKLINKYVIKLNSLNDSLESLTPIEYKNLYCKILKKLRMKIDYMVCNCNISCSLDKLCKKNKVKERNQKVKKIKSF